MTKTFLAILFALVLTSCVLLPGYSGPPRAATGPEIFPPSPWKDLRGIVHCHSYLSHDSKGTPEEIAQAAHRVGVDFVMMTDHYTDRGVLEAMRGFHGRTLFLPGAECRKDGRYFLALGIEKPLDLSQSWPQIHAQIREQGGLLFLDHLEEYGEEIEAISFDGLELYNIHAAVKLSNPLTLLLRGLLFPPHAVFPSLCWLHKPNLKQWEKASRKCIVPIVAGNDAHNNVRLFGPLGGVVGTYEQLFRTANTHVWARENSREAILEALREGRSYIAFEWLAAATGFQIETREENGDTFCHVFVPEKAQIRLLRNGETLAQTHGQSLMARIPAASEAFRVEVYLRDRLWILSGPVPTTTSTP